MTPKYFFFMLFGLSLFLGFTACNTLPVKEQTHTNQHDYPMTKSSYVKKIGTLYGIIVADTHDNSSEAIRQGPPKDKENMIMLLSDIAKYTGLDHKPPWFIDGGVLFSKKQVISQLTQLSSVATTQDLIVFYYSGHGERNSENPEGWPNLCVDGKGYCMEKENRLDFQEEVIKKLKQTPHRMFIAIADTCNKSSASKGGASDNKGAMPSEKSENYRKLFLAPKGSIIFASAKIGQNAYVTIEGSRFTNKFLTVLKDDLVGDNPSWKNIKEEATQEITDDTSGDKQQPISEINLIDEDVPPIVIPDNDIQFQVLPDDHFQPGEELQFAVTSRQEDGYLFVFNAEVKDDSTLFQLFPSHSYRELTGKNEFSLRANEPLVIPNTDYDDLRYTQFNVSEDPGTHFLIALLVTQTSDLRKVQSLQGQPIDTKNGQAEVNSWFTSKLPGIPVAVVKYQIK